MPSSPIWFPARKSDCRVREGSVNLNLAANRIGSDGMTALATALGKGALANLQALSFGDFLGCCNIGDDGMKAFADALVKGALSQLKVLGFEDNQIGDAGVAALASACGNGALTQLTYLNLYNNEIGDEGVMEGRLAPARRCGRCIRLGSRSHKPVPLPCPSQCPRPSRKI